MKKSSLTMTLLLLSITHQSFAEYTNIPDGSSLVVLSAARADDSYYNPKDPTKPNRYYDIIDFHSKFSSILLKNGVNVVINCDIPTCKRLRNQGVPNDILWRAGISDIWMRDFSRVGIKKQVGFQLQPAYLGKQKAKEIQKSFDNAVRQAGLKFNARNDWVIDGGNVVDNFVDTAILTDRVLTENNLSHSDSAWTEATLAKILGYSKVSLIPEIDGDTTGHADGMVSFINKNTLAYSDFDDETYDYDGRLAKESMMATLKKSLGSSINLVAIPYTYPSDNTGNTQGYKGFTSGCGTHVNALYTGTKLFVPTFGGDPENAASGLTPEADKAALDAFNKNAGSTEVIEVPVPKKICEIGGSVRCLSWLVEGDNANRLVTYVAQESANY